MASIPSPQLSLDLNRIARALEKTMSMKTTHPTAELSHPTLSLHLNPDRQAALPFPTTPSQQNDSKPNKKHKHPTPISIENAEDRVTLKNAQTHTHEPNHETIPSRSDSDNDPAP
ncbi:MAG: hypothetical protein FRX48_07060 [Lasallia pustulata]|uniref:Uncharacterized protein n=1 Tax=Lasallia pustulata TaxID=136370 RepID=A0A5M8PL89_9LECA|nr:MAG: hypothetical protein FRX48_07060 [Lasallia pustulata]